MDAEVALARFNSFGSRRGNHEAMMRGTFGNIRLQNRMVAPREGGWTPKLPEREELPVYDAATARLDTAVEVTTYRNGGMLPYVLRRMLMD